MANPFDLYLLRIAYNLELTSPRAGSARVRQRCGQLCYHLNQVFFVKHLWAKS